MKDLDIKEEKYYNLGSIDINKLYSSSKKKKLNLSRMNYIYRVQMNRTFFKYNPESHLKDLNYFQKDDINLRSDMEKIKSKMNERVTDRCTGKYFKKQMEKLKQTRDFNKKILSDLKLNSIGNADTETLKKIPYKIPFNIFLKNSENNEEDSNVCIIPNGYKIRAYYDKICRDERIRRLLMKKGNVKVNNNSIGDMFDKDYKMLEDTLEKLFHSLEIDPINKYIDNYKNQKSIQNKEILTDREKKYFPNFHDALKIMAKMEESKKLKKNEKTPEEIEKCIQDMQNELIKNLGEHKLKTDEEIKVDEISE